MMWHRSNCHKNTREDLGKDKNPLNSYQLLTKTCKYSCLHQSPSYSTNGEAVW